MGLLAITFSITASVYTIASHAYRSVFPDISILRTHFPLAIGKEGKRNTYKFIPNRPAHWVDLKSISPRAVAAILVSEDGGFFHHEGYEPELIRKAWEENRRAGRYKRGASTITQQVVKNLFLSPEKTMSRKIRELLLDRKSVV